MANTGGRATIMTCKKLKITFRTKLAPIKMAKKTGVCKIISN